MATRNDLVELPSETPPADEPTVPADNPKGFAPPEGFDSVDAFITYAREEFDADAAYDKVNRDAALEDLKFVAGEQWDELVKADRLRKGRPCLTINVLPQFIGQVIGDRRQNKTTIKVRPRTNEGADLADIRSGLIKAIEAHSRAERVYDAALEAQVTCGISNFRIDLDYASNDVFDQDIMIRHIPNPLAVVWDRMSVDPTGRDARHCFVQDTIPRKTYDRMYPEHPCPAELGDGMIMSEGWFDNDVVRITEFWRLIERPRTVALMNDGDVKDITDLQPEEYQQFLWIDPKTGRPRIRRTMRTYAQMYLITGFAILDGPYELPITRLPIIKVEGRVTQVGEDRLRFGLVRFAKDSQRLKNYWRSVAAETLAMAPKTQWLAPASSVKGRENDFRTAHLSGDPLLIHNDGAERPTRENPPPFPAALVQEAQLNQQDIKDTTGLHDASLGMRSNEISGRAINARKLEGDVATIMYHDNLNASIQEGGSVVNELIPIAYDAPRTVRIIGADDREKLIKINDPEDADSPDITTGKYDVAIETGPSYTTQRQEAAEAMMQAIQVAPNLMEIAGDLIVKAQDWPGAQEISERLKRIIPAKVTGEQEQPDPQQQAAEQMQQQAMQAQLEDAAAQLQHAAEMREIELEKANADLEKAKADALRAAADADKAEADAQRAEVEANFAPAKARAEMLNVERTTSAKIEQMKNRGAGSPPAADRNQAQRKKK